MRIYNSVTIDIETGEIEAEDSYEYDGPVAGCYAWAAAIPAIISAVSSIASSSIAANQPTPAGMSQRPMPGQGRMPEAVPGQAIDWEKLLAMLLDQSSMGAQQQPGGVDPALLQMLQAFQGQQPPGGGY